VTFAAHLPRCPVGTRFCQFFSHRFNFIEAPATDDRPKWRTEKTYPIEHRNLWHRWQDPETLIGLSFASTTHYALHDIDAKSPYHPDQDEAAFKALLGAYENIGLTDPIVVQSSASGGIHVYFVFPKALPTFDLAVLFKRTAIAAGFKVKDGTLELFPNQKWFNEKKPTPYKAHRLPLQTGSYLLDQDYVPYSNQISTFLDRAEEAAAAADIDLLETALKASQNRKDFRRIRGDGQKAAAFAADLKQQFEEGWSDYGQTNDLLRVIGTYGRVFEGLSGSDLRDYIVATAQALPGYRQYCQHQHELHRRAKDWGRCIEKFYYPYGSTPDRQGSFAHMAAKASKTTKENYRNKERQTDAIQRIKEAVEWLKRQGKTLPTKVGAMKHALLEAMESLFNITASNDTLYRYRELWHPKFQSQTEPSPQEEPTAETDTPKPEASEDKGSGLSHTPHAISTADEPTPESPEPAPNNTSSLYPTPPLYMKVKEWISQGTVLLYVGPVVSTLVQIEGISSLKLRSLASNQRVILTGEFHSTYLFHPYDSDQLQVYVQPVEQAGLDKYSIPVLAKHLIHPP